jgi:AraC-like DNA-binding protein
MARPLRIEFPGALYHVTARGNAGQQRFAARPALAKVSRSSVLRSRSHRNEAIRRAHLEHGYGLSEIGRVVGLHSSTISRIVNREAGAQGKI